MTPVFRSRGIRIIKDKENCFTEQMKIYYEPENELKENRIIQRWLSTGILSLFEYSMVEENVIDTYNFHVNLMDEVYREMYDEMLAEGEKKLLGMIPVLFDESFRNYTVGYRIAGQEIAGQSYYFYPTVLGETRYKIRGIVDDERIYQEIQRFSEYVSKGRLECENEIKAFGRLMHKLKGISIHIAENNVGYKLYGRIRYELLKKYLMEIMGYELERNKHYGDVVLAAQRIQRGRVTGYNIYYLS